MPWLTLREAVDELDGKVSYATCRRLATSGKVKGTRVLGKILLDRESFDEYLRNEGYSLIAPSVRHRRKH